VEDETQESAIAFANFAHSYCTSAITLQHSDVEATHADAVVRYLYYHSIELYLKAYLISHGIDAKTLRRNYGHNIGKLTHKSAELGLEFSEIDGDVFEFMKSTDTVITSRYIRLGHHRRFPNDFLQITCLKLHQQVVAKVYDDAGITRRPILSISLDES
jgi:hypothetical protein